MALSVQIRESEEIRLTKTRDGSKTEMQVEFSGAGDKRQKQLLVWSRNRFFMGDCNNFKVVKANMPEKYDILCEPGIYHHQREEEISL